MTCNLYNSTDNPKTIGKTLTGGTAVSSLKPYEPISELTGSILISYSGTKFDYNYISVDFSNDETPHIRKYFITDKELELGGKLRLILKLDVLETYGEDILECKAVYDRTNNVDKANVDLIDGIVRTSADCITERIKFVTTDYNVGLDYPGKVIMVCNA